MRSLIQKLNKYKVLNSNSKIGKHDRSYYCVRSYWSIIEQALLEHMMKKEHEISRAALVRRCIHERGMRTLSEEYYEIIKDPLKYIKT